MLRWVPILSTQLEQILLCKVELTTEWAIRGWERAGTESTGNQAAGGERALCVLGRGGCSRTHMHRHTRAHTHALSQLHLSRSHHLPAALTMLLFILSAYKVSSTC